LIKSQIALSQCLRHPRGTWQARSVVEGRGVGREVASFSGWGQAKYTHAQGSMQCAPSVSGRSIRVDCSLSAAGSLWSQGDNALRSIVEILGTKASSVFRSLSESSRGLDPDHSLLSVNFSLFPLFTITMIHESIYIPLSPIANSITPLPAYGTPNPRSGN